MRWRTSNWGIGVLALGVLAVGCATVGEGAGEPEAPAEAVEPEEAPQAVEQEEAPEAEADPCPRDGAQREVSAACIDPWPLTVDSGTLRCNASSVTIAADGNVWAVNGMATTRGDGDEIDPIWAEGDVTPRVNIGALIDAGLELCG